MIGFRQVFSRATLGVASGDAIVDADIEIEKAAGIRCRYFSPQLRGEAEFRSGEARVIVRLLEGGPQVCRPEAALHELRHPGPVAAKGISVWLNAEADVLMSGSEAGKIGRC